MLVKLPGQEIDVIGANNTGASVGLEVVFVSRRSDIKKQPTVHLSLP